MSAIYTSDSCTPGGVLVIEDWEQWTGQLLCAAWQCVGEVHEHYQVALLPGFADARHDSGWSVKAADAVLAEGPVDVDVAVGMRSWTGGSAG